MRRRAALLVALAVTATAPGAASDERGDEKESAKPQKSFAEAVEGLEKRSGLIDLYVDAKGGRVLLELPPASGGEALVGEYLYIEGLTTGLGSNPVGLDRGQIGETRLVRLRRLGGRLLVEQPNLGFRALSDDPEERAAARESFATAVLWAGKFEAVAEDGRAVVDFTSFLVRDAHGVAARLERDGHGEFKLDPERSAVDLGACLSFPENLEFEALLTYAGKAAGPEVPATSPLPDAFTVVQHHSLVRLPDDAYRPRAFDPRAGSFAIFFHDYAAPLDEPIETRWIVRHRLRAGPDAEPELVYYVDPGAPEPVRGALLDGAGWWAEAFDAAGFPGAFRVEPLPEGVHPLDVRYNVIQWVHRATRGWSYGGGVVDPRTGERIKGHITLGSLRVRQDRLLFEGLVGAERTGSGAADDPLELALARIRQLAAHEVGHGLGLAHNFAASTYGRASVMDYPAPLVDVAAESGLVLTDAYAVGMGQWDRHAIRYAYAELAPEEEAAGLAAIVREGLERGLVMLSDADARPPGAADPRASLWDNGADAVAQLDLEMEVRRRALESFGEGNVAPGRPLALLEEVLATVYFRHRYQLEAAVKTVGGAHYHYALRGDGQPPVTIIDGAAQRRALAAVLATLRPEALKMPAGALAALHPRPFGYGPNRELVRGASAPLFDPLAAASTAADLAVSGLLQPQRAARLVEQHRRRPELPGFLDVAAGLVAAAFDGDDGSPARAELRRAVQTVVVRGLIRLSADPESSPAVQAIADSVLEALAERLETTVAGFANNRLLVREIRRHLERPGESRAAAPTALAPPPGSPIGAAAGTPGLPGSEECWNAPRAGAAPW